jgi:predicted negative regulator of RcsB-dependent stress response
VRAEVRHQLKQDRFNKVTMEAAERTMHWSAEHKNRLMIAGLGALIVAAGVFFAWYTLNQQDQQASFELSQAVRIMETPLRPPNMPPQAEAPSYASSKERATAAQKDLQEVIGKYPHTRSADFARYFMGVTSSEMGDDAAATKQFQGLADSHNSNLSALAKLALASLYRSQHQDKQAIDIYRGLIDKPTETVSKTTAQIGLAEAYESGGQPLEAKRIYEQVQKENPSSAVAQLAQEKLQGLNKPAGAGASAQ